MKSAGGESLARKNTLNAHSFIPRYYDFSEWTLEISRKYFNAKMLVQINYFSLRFFNEDHRNYTTGLGMKHLSFFHGYFCFFSCGGNSRNISEALREIREFILKFLDLTRTIWTLFFTRTSSFKRRLIFRIKVFEKLNFDGL
jgi:hypothetical protein